MRALALALIVLAGLGLRLGYAIDGPTEILDSAAYGRIAVGLYEEGEFEQHGPGTPAHAQPASNYTPGLPLLVAGIYELSGGVHPELTRIVLALLATLAIPFAYLLARQGVPGRGSRSQSVPDSPGSGWSRGDAAGLFAAAGVAVYPPLLEYGGMYMTEPLGATLVSGSVLAILWARDRGRSWGWALPGLCLGLLAMVRPEYLMISLFLAAVVLWLERGRGLPRMLAPPALMLLVTALVIAPWTIRNAVVLDRFVPLSTGGGQTLFTGAYTPSGGDPQEVGSEVIERNPWVLERLEAENRASGEGPESITLERVLATLAGRRHPGLPSDAALARMGRERYLDELRVDPLGLGAYLAGKAGRIWLVGARDVMKQPFWIVFHAVFLLLALVGAWRLVADRREEMLVIGAILLAATAVGVVLVASPRRVLVLWPLVAALAGIGAAEIAARTKAARTAREGHPSAELN